MEATSPVVHLRFVLERLARLETLAWCLPTAPDWREAPRVILASPSSEGNKGTELTLFSCPMTSCIFLLRQPGSACEFVVNTSNAGPGALAVTIDGPSKVKMDCVECPEGYRVTYTPMAPGNYLISIKYGGPYHIVGSPFKAKITGNDKKSHNRETEEGTRLSNNHFKNLFKNTKSQKSFTFIPDFFLFFF